MAVIPGFRFDITGASGSQGLLSPRASWRAYVLPRGGYASAASTGTTITFDSSDIADRFRRPAGVFPQRWIQVGTDIDKIVRVTGVGGNSITVNTAVTVAENDRVFCIGTTQPSTSGGSASYITPDSLIYQRGDDGADLYTNSLITSDTNGTIFGYANVGAYDVIVQDGNQTIQGYIADMPVGVVEGVSVATWAHFGSTVTMHAALGVTGHATFGATLTVHGNAGVTGTLVVGSSTSFMSGVSVTGGVTATGTLSIGQTATIPVLLTRTSPLYDIRTYGAIGDGTTDDSTAIQAAIDAAEAAGGGTVYVPESTFAINTGLAVENVNVIVRGDGRGSILKALSAITMITVNGGSSANSGNRVERLHFDLNSTASTGILLNNGNSGVVSGVHFTNPVAGSFGVRTSGGAHETVINDFDWWSSVTRGVAIEVDTNNCKIRDGSIIGASTGINLTPTAAISPVTIDGMRISSCADGIRVPNRGMLGLFISNTRFEGNSVSDINARGFDTTNNRLFGCYIRNVYTSNGVRWAFQNVKGLIIDGVVFKGWSGSAPGVTFSSAVSGVYTTNVTGESDTTTYIFADDNYTGSTGLLHTWGHTILNTSGNTITAYLGDALASGTGLDQTHVGTRKVILTGSTFTHNATVTVLKHETSDPEVFTFTGANQSLALMWDGVEWVTIKNKGVTV